MSIQTELSRIINAKAAIKAAIEGKGVTVPEATLLDGMASLIESIKAGGGDTQIDRLIDRSITEISNDRVTSIGSFAFHSCSALKAADFQTATSIGRNAFQSTVLTTAYFPAVTSIGIYAFYSCKKLTTVDFPVATSIGTHAFFLCTALKAADFQTATSIGIYAFYSCSDLTALILRSETIATLSNTNAFTNTPIESGTGYIYVPAALVDSYKAATNWSTYANQIRAIEDYPDITGGAA